MTGSHASPPRPPLTLRVGVTGHRSARLKGREAPIRVSVERALREIQRVLITELSSELRSAYDVGQPSLRIVSALADGSDLLIADIAHRLGFDVQAILPCSAIGVRHTIP